MLLQSVRVSIPASARASHTDQMRLACRDVCNGQNDHEEEEGQEGEALGGARHDTVAPGEDGQLVQPRYKVPAGCRVARHKDADSDYGESVHLRGCSGTRRGGYRDETLAAIEVALNPEVD